MKDVAAILDCYTVEPSGLGVPPYLSTYARAAYGALATAFPGTDVRYLTIDDVRWCLNDGQPYTQPPLSDPLTYSTTVSRNEALKILANAVMTVVIAGDAVPSVHLQAQNGSVEEIAQALACVRGRRVLLGPLASWLLGDPGRYAGLFDAVHTHTVTSADLGAGSRAAAPYARLTADRVPYEGLISQLGWRPVAEVELYRGEPGCRGYRAAAGGYPRELPRSGGSAHRQCRPAGRRFPDRRRDREAGCPVLQRGELRADGDREFRPGSDRGQRADVHTAGTDARDHQRQRSRGADGAARPARLAARAEPDLRPAGRNPPDTV